MKEKEKIRVRASTIRYSLFFVCLGCSSSLSLDTIRYSQREWCLEHGCIVGGIIEYYHRYAIFIIVEY
jgi:hypothetical protein